MPKSTPRFMERGADTCRLIDFPVVASGQLPQPFREWLGEANDQMLSFILYRKVKKITSDVYGTFFDRTVPSWGFHGSSDILQTLLKAPPSWFPNGGAENDVNQYLGRVFWSPLWRWRKMAALPLPAAILDDLIPGSGNEVIQDGGRKRKGRHLAPPPQWGSKNAPYTTIEAKIIYTIYLYELV